MANIDINNISNLDLDSNNLFSNSVLDGNDLFEDSESFIAELNDDGNEQKAIMGGLALAEQCSCHCCSCHC